MTGGGMWGVDLPLTFYSLKWKTGELKACKYLTAPHTHHKQVDQFSPLWAHEESPVKCRRIVREKSAMAVFYHLRVVV